VHAPFESILEYEAFSLRVPEQQLDDLAQLLAAVPEQELKQMQHNLRQVWHRWVTAREGPLTGARLLFLVLVFSHQFSSIPNIRFNE
jgi:hypothetical protein